MSKCLHLNFKNEPGFVCSDCGQEFITQEDRIERLEAKLKKVVEALEKKYSCQMCGHTANLMTSALKEINGGGE